MWTNRCTPRRSDDWQGWGDFPSPFSSRPLLSGAIILKPSAPGWYQHSLQNPHQIPGTSLRWWILDGDCKARGRRTCSFLTLSCLLPGFLFLWVLSCFCECVSYPGGGRAFPQQQSDLVCSFPQTCRASLFFTPPQRHQQKYHKQLYRRAIIGTGTNS